MRLSTTIIAAALVAAGTAQAEPVAPDAVQFDEYGAVAVSLTGVPGNPENGPALMNKGQGNCIACHETPALAHLPFHGEVGPMLEFPGDTWSEAELRGIVANAKNTFPDSMMPSFYKTSGHIRPGDAYTGKAAKDPVAPILSAQDIEDIVAYLLTLKE